MTMPAISLWQPWASLLVTRQLCVICDGREPWDCTQHLNGAPMVKRFETRSWACPPSLIGQRFAIHAAARKPNRGARVGEFYAEAWHDTVRHIEDCYCDHEEIAPACSRRSSWRPRMRRHDRDEWIDLPLGAIVGSGVVAACYQVRVGPDGETPAMAMYEDQSGGYVPLPIPADQLPYGDFTPGRFAWLIEDAAPTTQRCPWCGGCGATHPVGWDGLRECRVCKGAGRCEPIPAKGRQRTWEWRL